MSTTTADSAAIRQAHKRLAKQHHPDRFPAGSAEQQQATARMAESTTRYRLIRKAPLRYHRVSEASDPTTPSTDTELDDDDPSRAHESESRSVDDGRRGRRSVVDGCAGRPGGRRAGLHEQRRCFQDSGLAGRSGPQSALRQPGPLTGLSTEASSKKISAQELESQLIQASGYFADAKLRCEPTTAGWDYICSYTPSDQTPFLRLHFGVNVDSTRMLQISQTVPLGVPIPPLGL